MPAPLPGTVEHQTHAHTQAEDLIMSYRRREAAAARARVRGGGEPSTEAPEASAPSEQDTLAADTREPLNELMTTDQLTRERALGHAFGGFTEARPCHQCDVSRRRISLAQLTAQGAITFPPTFKFDKGHKATQTDQCVCVARVYRRRSSHARANLSGMTPRASSESRRGPIESSSSRRCAAARRVGGCRGWSSPRTTACATRGTATIGLWSRASSSTYERKRLLPRMPTSTKPMEMAIPTGRQRRVICPTTATRVRTRDDWPSSANLRVCAFLAGRASPHPKSGIYIVFYRHVS